ncbi:ChrR family anti-sigma-E factor [Marinomonas algarum]|uniref:ChrR family anti-sigma-E factor n=1 Tax=Marinomonas algarum TaxID=2883105 RepID=A0A9X1IPA6_9GAMM|nr:ChrR family anti-sigma-E factor [Marinomonas algarum]MCB5162544.1 ChrR family anti-sigma-E factor [Marinomonas algarum]
MTHYHPSIETLTDYAAGSLPLAHSLCISTHLELCSECQQQVRKLEMLGSEFFEDTKSEDRQLNSLKDSFFAHLETESHSATLAEQAKEEKRQMLDQTNESKALDWDAYKVPKSLRQFIPKGYDDLKWSRISPSFKMATLCNEEGGAQIALTRIKAGSHMPTHTHTGDELTLVLEGAFSDESGVYRQGDFISRDSSHKHQPIVTKDAECICLTVLDAPVEFTGWFTRLLNPILRRHHPHSGL